MPIYYFFGGVTVSLTAMVTCGGVTVSLLISVDSELRLLAGGVTVSLIVILVCGGVTVSLLINVVKFFVLELGLTLLFLVHATMETAINDATKPVVNNFFILINFMLMINTNIVKGNSRLRINQELPLG